MRHEFRTTIVLIGITLLVLLSTAEVASTQDGSNTTQPQLNAQQQHSVNQGLAQQPNDTPPTGYQGQLGAKLPDSMTAHSMPGNVATNVPEMKKMLFVKLPDRVLLIDPDTKVVAEILLAEDTTGSTGDSSSAPKPDSQK
jgi:hypothetical protein